jgi:small subunit ribosomal protein S15
MPLAAEAKAQAITTYRVHKTDTGSPEVQIAILTKEIAHLTDHFKTHKKDHSSRRGLLNMVAQRRKLLDYLKSRSPERYKNLIVSLGLRH